MVAGILKSCNEHKEILERPEPVEEVQLGVRGLGANIFRRRRHSSREAEKQKIGSFVPH